MESKIDRSIKSTLKPELIHLFAEGFNKARSRHSNQNATLPKLVIQPCAEAIKVVGNDVYVCVEVTNEGTGNSSNTFIRLYSGPGEYGHPLSDYKLCDSQRRAISAGGTVIVGLKWMRFSKHFRPVIGPIAVCFDPLLDPLGFVVVEEHHSHIAFIPVVKRVQMQDWQSP